MWYYLLLLHLIATQALAGDDFVKAVKGALNSVFDFLGDRDGCFFKCPNGGKPVAKNGHKPKANGCGAFGIRLDMTLIPAAEKCCDEHDKCYHTCRQLKEDCDDKFRKCLSSICKGLKDIVSKDVYDGCKTTADVMYTGTMTLGCLPYKESQQDACTCQSRPSRGLEL